MMPFAFVFPGQGSQSVGMLDAWGDHPAVVQTLKEAADALGQDIARLIKEGPREALALTTNTQPVMLVAGVAAYRAWLAEDGASPAVVAGHSLGEYAALVAAGVLSLSDALPLVRFRAQAMQEAVPVGTGAMAAILGLDAQKVIAVCAGIAGTVGENGADVSGHGVVEAVNFNDPMQTVIAGNKLAVDKACEALKAAGAKRCLPLPVSAPFHSSLMRTAAERLRERLASVVLQPPKIPVINNVDVAVLSDPALIRKALVRQAASPVRWVESIAAMKSRGISTVVECGPGKVLAGLVKRIDAELTGAALYDPVTLAQTKELLQ